MRLTLDDVLKATGGSLLTPGSSTPGSMMITGVGTDTRRLAKGDLFVALRGPRADGHDFVGEAFRQGAAAAVVTRTVDGVPPGAPAIQVDDGGRALVRLAQFYRRTLSITVVGVTGSVGKTTTTGMCAAILGTRFTVVRTPDDWNAEIGVPLTLLGLGPGHDVAVIEMAMRGLGQIADLVEMARPQIGIVTNVGDSHLGLLGTKAQIAKAKSELIVGLPPDGTAILNADDPLVAAMAPLARGRVMTYGLGGGDVRAPEITAREDGVSFRVLAGGRGTTARMAVWGDHNVSNALAAITAGLALGLDLDTCALGLSTYAPPKMRLQPIQVGELLLINDAYNASPDSMRVAFAVASQIGAGRRMVGVLGEMKELGPRSPEMHRRVGWLAAQCFTTLVAVGGADAVELAEGARLADVTGVEIRHVPDVDQAGDLLLRIARPRDVVLLKGSRAMGMERIVDRLREVRPA